MLPFAILQVNRQPKAFDYLKFWHNRIILVRNRAVCCVMKSGPMCTCAMEGFQNECLGL